MAIFNSYVSHYQRVSIPFYAHIVTAPMLRGRPGFGYGAGEAEAVVSSVVSSAMVFDDAKRIPSGND